MSPCDVYLAIESIAHERNLPRAFKTDLTKHDRLAIERYPGRPFAWLLYQHGTHLVWVDKGEEHAAERIFRLVLSIFSDAECVVAFYDGKDRLSIHEGQVMPREVFLTSEAS